MIRARAAAFFDDDDDNDETPAPTWIMGIPYTGVVHNEDGSGDGDIIFCGDFVSISDAQQRAYQELREEERRLDVFSTMWITYRSGFPRMEPYGYTDDSGWGCMLRSAQMLMTQALQRHTLGRHWRVPRALEERLRVPEYRTLVRLFADHPGEESLFSIHNMCQVGIRYDKLPGEWYGPTTAACVLRDISELFAARISPRAPTRRKPGRSSTGCCCARPEQPPPSLTSPAKSARTEEEATPAAPVVVGAAEGLPKAGAEVDAGVGGEERWTANLGKSVSSPRDGREDEAAAGDGCDRGPGRPAEGCGECGTANGNGSDSGSGSGGCSPSRDIAGDGRGPDEAFPSARPLRVFVSQGDVVYVDEVETVAVRGGGEEAVSTENDAAGFCHACGENVEAAAGAAARKADLDTAGARRPDAGARSVADGGGATPAFFDPLLNPGSNGKQNQQGEAWSSAVVLLVPLRLGLDELSAGYIPSLLETLRVPQSLGFLGGRPNHAIFFIGAQGETLIGLDPHTTQAAPDMANGFPSERYMRSLHCQSAVSMDVRRIDPSLALAFYLPGRAAFQDLVTRIRETNPPPFSVEQTRPDYEGEMGLAFMINQRDDDGTTDDDDDEYVFVKGPER